LFRHDRKPILQTFHRTLKRVSEQDALVEALRQTERHLEEQHTLTTAADQRAVAFASVMIVVLGILLGNEDAQSIDASKGYVIFGFLVSIALAFFSARPTRIFGSGGNGDSLKDFIGARAEGYLLSTLIERNDRNIAHNDKVLRASAMVFRVALAIALFSALILLMDWANATNFLCQMEKS
jgi:predicted permease